MRRWFIIGLLALFTGLLPGVALAQGSPNQADDFLLRVNGPMHIGNDEHIGSAVSIGNNATIDGTVDSSLVVINGDAVVNGEVLGDLTVVSGTLDIRSGARVHNVSLVNSTMTQAPDARVTGTISRSTATVSDWQLRTAWFLFWGGITVLILLAGLLFAAIGGRQLTDAGNLLAREPLPVILISLGVGILLPILAILAFPTIVGIPFGLAIFFFVLPALWLVGYLIAGTKLGAVLLRAAGTTMTPEHPYLAALTGLLILQIIGLIPVLGGIVVALAGAFGAGGALLLAWRAFRTPGRPEAAEPMPARPEPTV